MAEYFKDYNDKEILREILRTLIKISINLRKLSECVDDYSDSPHYTQPKINCRNTKG